MARTSWPKAGRWFACTLIGWLALQGGMAQAQHPNDAGGFSPDGVYQIGDVDSVSLFNGNLTIAIPLGRATKVGHGLDFSLNLVYSSSAWKLDEVFTASGETFTQAYPKKTNAGLGWNVSLGRLSNPSENDWVPPEGEYDQRAHYSPCETRYLGPDGSDVRFYETLQPVSGKLCDPLKVFTTGYSRDGSYMRLDSLANDYGVRQLRFADGRIHTFDGGGNLIKMENRFGSSIDISYSGTKWIITEKAGNSPNRFHEVIFTGGRVSEVKVQKFGGGHDVYRFGYSGPVTINRPCPANAALAEHGGKTVSVYLLAYVEQPDETRWTPEDPSGVHSTGYVTDAGWGFGDYPRCYRSGLITGLRLPTQGAYEWDFDVYQFSTDNDKPSYSNSAGVVARRMVTGKQGSAKQRTVLGEWTYDPDITGTDPRLATELINTVTDPLGHVTKHYFDIGIHSGTYGLAMTPTRTGYGLNLSRQEFDAGDLVKPMRSVYVQWQHDTNFGVESGHEREDLSNLNRRQTVSRTVFHKDADRYTQVNNSLFDGFGHFEKQIVSGTLRTDGTSDQRTVTTDFVPNATSWLLDNISYRQVQEAGLTFHEDFCFSAKGYLARHRRLASTNGARGGTDVLRVYTPDNNGFTTTERHYGGDAGGIPTGSDICALALPAPKYTINHEYQYGALRRSQYQGTSHYIADGTIDVSGLVSLRRDVSGIETRYEYDELGRLTWAKPAEEAWTNYNYQPAMSVTAQPRVVVRQFAHGATQGAHLTQRTLNFDPFGRLVESVREHRSLDPATSKEKTESFSSRTTYDAAGNVDFQSEAGYPFQGTSLEDFDPFGRAATVRRADGSVTTFTYAGAGEIGRSVKISTENGVQTATTKEHYDVHGRLWRVNEPIGTQATYTYDGRDDLRKVVMTDGSATQTRQFTYDGRRFLTSETHPEKSGAVTYSAYDPMGHAGSMVDGPNELAYVYDAAGRLTHLYQVRGPEGSWTTFPGHPGRLVKKLTYETAEGPGKGKVVEAVRYNHLRLGASPNFSHHTFKEAYTYTYGGRGGRVSGRLMEEEHHAEAWRPGLPDKSDGTFFDQGWSWTELGQVSTVTYPQCLHSLCNSLSNATQSFNDVGTTHPYWADIQSIYDAGITLGCGGGKYCPNNLLTRAEMAVFLLRAIEGAFYQPPACTTAVFSDVPCSHWAASWINELARRGITDGCGLNNFCPNDKVTRAQMAIFLYRIVHGPTHPTPACTSNPFNDVSCSDWFGPWVVKAYQEGLIAQDTRVCSAGSFCPNSTPNRAEMAKILADGFSLARPTNAMTPRTVTYRYRDGRLTGVGQFAEITHEKNLMVEDVTMGNQQIWCQRVASHGMPRPDVIGIKSGNTCSGLGPYTYDAAGNITSIGGDQFRYDQVSRLTQMVQSGGRTQDYEYDGFGNIKEIKSAWAGYGRTTPTNPWNNRLVYASYDQAGSLTHWNGATYTYDGLNQMTRMQNGGEDWIFIYDADDRRVRQTRIIGGDLDNHFTLRDLDGKELRSYKAYQPAGKSWSWGKPESDHIYRGSTMIATDWIASGVGLRYHFVDHLGTPRITTGYGEHHYLAFGEETTPLGDAERLKFTGHERDAYNPNSTADDLDYMHARFYNPLTARFTSVDPKPGAVVSPQSWNRYAYAANNPIRFIDPDGRATADWDDRLPAGISSAEFLVEAIIKKLPASVASKPVVATVGRASGVAALVVFLNNDLPAFLGSDKEGVDFFIEGLQALDPVRGLAEGKLEDGSVAYAEAAIDIAVEKRGELQHLNFLDEFTLRTDQTASPKEKQAALARIVERNKQISKLHKLQKEYEERLRFYKK